MRRNGHKTSSGVNFYGDLKYEVKVYTRTSFMAFLRMRNESGQIGSKTAAKLAKIQVLCETP